MNTRLFGRFLMAGLMAGLGLVLAGHAPAQTAQFLRMVGPTAVTITKFRPDAALVWSGATSGATYTVQVATTLTSGGNWVDYNQIVASSSVNTNPIFAFNPPAGMSFIQAGPFTIGDTLDGDSDAIPTNVTVSTFYMETNLVSYSQWQPVYSYATNQGYGFDNAGAGKAANHPVQTVNWYDVVKWCNARSQQTGLTPVYYTDAAFTAIYTNGDVDAVYVNWSADGYRLPTEAEWEKAARGGLSGQRFPWGNTISWNQANYWGDPFSLDPTSGYPYDLSTRKDFDPAFSGGDNGDYPYTSPVGSFPANGYGLHDMAGNVIEWCWDWYAGPPNPAGSPYLGGADPHGPASGSYGFRVFRGGSWDEGSNVARCAERSSWGGYPGAGAQGIGFRCVRGL